MWCFWKILLGTVSASAEEPSRAEEEVVVEASRAPDGAEVATVARPGMDDVGDVLAWTPGVQVARLGGPGARAAVRIRASSFRQVQVHLDGVPLNPDGSDAVDLSDVPLAALEEVVVWRGFAPGRYGGAPIGGTVDLVTRRPERGVVGSYRLGAASFGTARLGAAVVGGGERADGLVAVDGLTTTGRFRWFDDRGTRFVASDDGFEVRENADVRQLGLLMRGRVEGNGVQGTALLSGMARAEGVPGPVGATSPSSRATASRLVGSAEVAGVRGRWRPGLRVQAVARREAYQDADGALGLGTPAATDSAWMVAGRAWVEGRPVDQVTVGARLDGRLERFSRSAPVAAAEVGPVGRGLLSGAAWLVGRWGPLVVEPVVELRGQVDAAGLTQTAALPRLGLTCFLGRSVWARAEAGLGLRPPDLTELYGLRGAVRSNAGLRPEHSRMVELSVGASGEAQGLRLSGQVVGFAQGVKDLIVYLQTAQRALVPQNVGLASVTGVELSGRLAWRKHLEVAAQVSAQAPRQRTPDDAVRGRTLPGVSTWLADVVVTGRPTAAVEIGSAVSAQSGLWRDAGNLARSPDRWTVDAWLRTQPWPAGPWFAVGLRNLTDRVTASVPQDPLRPDGPRVSEAVTDLVGYPLPGRSVFVEIVGSFGGGR